MTDQPIISQRMDMSDRAGGLSIEFLNESNYDVWRTCMESYLVGEDLWDVVDGNETKCPKAEATAHDETSSSDAVKKWKRLNAKAEFALKRSISHSLFYHVKRCKSARGIWQTLDRLLNKKKGGHFLGKEHDEEDPLKRYKPLHEAAVKGDWEAAESIFNTDPEALRAIITARGETALHVAADLGRAGFVEKLVARMPPGDLEIQTDKQSRGRTALHYAVVCGSLPIVKTLVDKNGKLMEIVDQEKYTPLHEAAYYFQSERVVRYLISKMPHVPPPYEDSPFFAGDKGAELIARLVDSRAYDICLHLLDKYPFLATATTYYGKGMLNELSLRPSGFLSGSKLGYLGRCIYKIIPIESNDKPRDSSSNCDLENQLVKEQPTLLQHLTSYLTRVPWVKRIKGEKYEHTFLKIACKEMSRWSPKEISIFFTEFPFFRAAAQNGAVEFITTFFEDFPHLVHDGASILEEAVVHRQEKVFNLFLGGVATMKHLAADYDRLTKDNIMHKAARLAPYPQLSSVSCSALQMQRELQWFKAVEKLLNPTQRFYRNQKGETPQEIFTTEHRKLLSDAVQWMKDTSNSCMVVTTLIATVLFSSVFAVPGGNVDGKGVPLFLQEKAFILFAVSDAVGLFSSTTSILMFLSILTARYAEEDFLYSLPKRLILGFASLFLAIASMMVAFGATLYMVLRERFKWIFIPIIVITSIPVVLFVMLQLPLFCYMLRSTYGSRIFHPKTIW